MIHSRILCLIAAGMLLPAHIPFGVTITLTGNNPTTVLVPGPCNGAGGPYDGCGATSYLSFSNTQATTDLFTNLRSSIRSRSVRRTSPALSPTGMPARVVAGL